MPYGFDFEDDDRRPRRPDPRDQQAGHGSSAFATMFGGTLGCAAGCGFLILVVVILAAMGSR